ncbi:MAG: hypothetical protein FVQ78_05860 [Solirubrobacterales bacterium]|nr:hypothetical protein [Solirubrobacterales bacterium]
MPFPLSPQTIGALIKALAEGNTHSELGTLFMSLGVEQWDQEGERINKEKRVHGVLKGLRAADDEPAAKAALALARSAVVAGTPRDGAWRRSAAPWWQPLLDALAADGLEFDKERGLLVPAVAEVSIARERSLLEQALEARGWVDAAEHYRQCADGIGSRNWESANGQGRSFLEDLIPRAASELGGAKAPREPRAALQFLRDKGLLLEGEFDFARGLWEMCNSRGSHAGQSSEEEARFRFVAISAYARFLLSRLD